MGTKSNFVQGAVVEFDSLKEYKTISKELTLQELIELKQATVAKIKSLVGSLTGSHNLKLEKVKKIINQIEALQYNLTIFKQLNAIANVGSPEKNMLGINGCIFQSSDLKTLNQVLIRINVNKYVKEGTLKTDLQKYLEEKVSENKKIIDAHYRTQTAYNKSMKIRVKYLDIKL